MPIYEYACPTCRHEFEQIVKVSAPPPPRPSCGSEEVDKKISLAAFHLKGGGWYSDAYSGSDNKKPGDAPAAKTESKSPVAAESSAEKATPASSAESAAPSKPAPKVASSSSSTD